MRTKNAANNREFSFALIAWVHLDREGQGVLDAIQFLVAEDGIAPELRDPKGCAAHGLLSYDYPGVILRWMGDDVGVVGCVVSRVDSEVLTRGCRAGVEDAMGQRGVVSG